MARADLPSRVRGGEALECDRDGIASSATSGPTGAQRTAVRPGRKTNRRMSPRECPLSETLVISKFWRNRRGEAIVTSLEPYEGRVIVHVRQFFTDAQGKLAPTKKGIAIDILRLPELSDAVTKALAKAIELDLIEAVL